MSRRRVGLVVAGAGARGAYEAGALSVLVPRLTDAGSTPTILVGTSAGALNVVALTALLGSGTQAASAAVVDLWGSLRLGDVVSLRASLAANLAAGASSLVGRPVQLPSLIDTSCQRETLGRLIDWRAFHDSIANGPVDAVALAATSTATGGTVVFVERKPSVELPPFDAVRNISYVDARIGIDHVLASAAVPVLFRPVWISRPARHAGWYLDGGVRLNTPLEPAVDFGCDRIGVVATQPAVWPRPSTAPRRGTPAPDVFAVGALLLQALLADRMVEDLKTLGTINELVGGATAAHRRIDYLFSGPSSNQADELGQLAIEVFHREFASIRGRRSPALWSLNRLIGGNAADRGDLLSFLYFDAAFTAEAARLGSRHASEQLGADGLGWRQAPRRHAPAPNAA